MTSYADGWEDLLDGLKPNLPSKKEADRLAHAINGNGGSRGSGCPPQPMEEDFDGPSADASFALEDEYSTVA
eukprot:12605807-Alexandrium_andersonii.AAC.1